MGVLRRATGWAGAVSLLLLAGCDGKKALVPALPPETGLFVQGAVDTVNHVVQLFWFGNDVDGTVVGFELRFKNPAASADTAWVFTTRTDSVFTVFTPSGYTAPRFEVRAIDDAGLRDPSPAVADFSFTNQPPIVTITGAPGAGDSTYASATLEWRTVDPDGDVNRVTHRVWLVGNEAAAQIVAGRQYTIPTEVFRENGELRSGPRSAIVQPIDDGGRVGISDTTTWYVRAPSSSGDARLLIVDDVPSSNQLNESTDQLYTDAATANLPPGTWSVLRLQFNRAFRSVKDLEQTFALFDAVIWYRGDRDGSRSFDNDPLRDFQDGIGTALESGKHVMLEGRALFRNTDVAGSTTGSIRSDLVSSYFGSQSLVEHPPTGSATDSPTVWGIDNGRILKSSLYADSLRFQGARSGLFCFAVRDTHDVAFWARGGPSSRDCTTPGTAIPDDTPAGITGDLTVVPAFPVRNVEVSVNIPHTNIGDLVVELRHGAKSVRLHNRSGGAADNLVATYPTTRAVDGPGSFTDFRNDPSNGTWTLFASDSAAGNVGSLAEWCLSLRGPTELSQGNTVDLPVGVRVRQPSGAYAVVLAFPLRVGSGYNSVPRILAQVLRDFGIAP